MKKKILSKILMVVMTASILLTGCGEQTESQEDSAQNSEVVQEVNENVEQGSLFSGTIFDNLILGETKAADVEKLLEDRFLEYEYEDIASEEYADDEGRYIINFHSVVGKTTITDEFYEWNALYRYTLSEGIEIEKENYLLNDWAVELLLNDDSEYKEAAQYIQGVIDENLLTEYAPIEDYYSDDMVQGDAVYYPIQKLGYSGVELIKYIMVGKYANCDIEDAEHIIVFSVGITPEEYYQQGEIMKYTTSYSMIPLLDVDEPAIAEPVESNDEIEKFQNIAFFITDDQCRCTSMVSLNSETGELKLVSVPRSVYMNTGDKYGKYSTSYGENNVEQAIRTLNSNLDMNIQDFIAIDIKTLSEFVDILGGVWIDVPEISNTTYDEYILSVLETDVPITLNEGYQLLNGDQLAKYCWYLGTSTTLDNESQLAEVFIALHERMQTVDEETLRQAINVFASKVYTSIEVEDVRSGMANISDYNYNEMSGVSFPQGDMRDVVKMGAMGSCIVPTELEANVIWLHEFLFGQNDYEVSETVKEYSSQIKEKVEEYKAE